MREVPTEIGELAGRLLALEAGDRTGPDALAEAGRRAAGRLSTRLAPLLGLASVHAFLARALHLAKAEVPFLAAVTVAPTAEQPLEGLGEALRGRGDEEARAALTALLVHFLALVAIFTGEELLSAEVARTWPQLQLESGR